ncbi:MAG: hypothetical protein IPM79_05180 [Polyangiaceae bacterium]|nr:hypothetical protein [Polyangiaceae bacterium]MBK8937036.1 hypothetical protein [Polyangiaceae bacterium]
MRSAPQLGVCAALLLAACAEGDDVELRFGEPGSEVEVRPDTPGNNLQFNFDRADLVEAFGSPGGRFLIHYTRDGDNAVPSADDDVSGVPDFVEEVAGVYDEVLGFYEGLGFRAPLDDAAVTDNGGDDRFDVYLVDFAGVGDGNFQRDGCSSTNPDQCRGYMIQENDYVGYGYPSTLVANRILGSHELFHAVQSAYDVEQGSVLAEGTAVWATEQFDPSLDDLEWFITGFFENVDRPLDEPLPGPADPYSYGAGVFFQFLHEALGPTVVRSLWERCEDGAGGVDDPYWLDVLDATLQDAADISFSDAYLEFATWNLRTDDFADPSASYASGDQYPRVRIDAETAPHSDDQLRVYKASSQYYGVEPGGRVSMTAALVAPAADPAATEGLRLLLATESGDSVTHEELTDVAAGTQTITTSTADRLVVVVVNTATTGDSKKPGLCIGTVEEVATCAAALSGEGGGGAGGGGAGGESGEGGGAGGDGADDTEDGCGCRVPVRRADSSGLSVVALGLALQLWRRRKKSSPSASA